MNQQLDAFSSDQAKMSVSHSVPPAPKPIAVKPNPRCLGFILSHDKMEESREGYNRPQTTIQTTTYSMNLALSRNWAMGCCGASTISGLTYTFPNEEKQQNFMALFMQFMDITYYALPASYQIGEAERNGLHLLSVLKGMGMEQVHVSANRVHGPNLMHLMVLDPKELNQEYLAKYVHQDEATGFWLPNHIKDKPDVEKAEIFREWHAANEAEVIKRQEDVKKKSLNDQLSTVDRFTIHLGRLVKSRRYGTSTPGDPQVVKRIDDMFKDFELPPVK
jgi:hypothetical protein